MPIQDRSSHYRKYNDDDYYKEDKPHRETIEINQKDEESQPILNTSMIKK